MDKVEAFATDEFRARVLLSLAAEPGHPVGGDLIRTHGAVETVRLALRAKPEDAASNQGRWLLDTATEFNVDAARHVIEDSRRDDTRLVTPDDPAWPSRLLALGEFAPWAVWLTGDGDRLSSPTHVHEVAVVGTSWMWQEGLMTTWALTDQLLREGYGIISTGERGVGIQVIDWATNAGARPLVVLPPSPFGPAPGAFDEFFEVVASQGVLISELARPHEAAVRRGLQRDRVLAAFADAVLVMNADADSECLWTARWAHQVGVPVGAVPAHRGRSSSYGCTTLIEHGIAVPVNNISEVIDLIDSAHAERTAHTMPNTTQQAGREL